MIAWALCAVVSVRGQDLDDRTLEAIEMLGDGVDADRAGEMADRLDDLGRHRLNPNRDGVRLLVEAGLLPAGAARAIERHIEVHGPIRSVYELQVVDGLPLGDARRIAPYLDLTAGETPTLRAAWRDARTSIEMRHGRTLQTAAGFTGDSVSPPAFAGSPDQWTLRAVHRSGQRLSLGVVVEKDPGERFVSRRARGPDLATAHVVLRPLGTLHTVALGDYHLQLGQGLVCWTGFGFGKTARVTDVERTGPVLRPYTSFNEDRMLRGAAATLALGSVHLTPFASVRRIDARLDTVGGVAHIASMPSGGLHRTAGERRAQRTTRETMTGLALRRAGQRGHVGAHVVVRRLEHPVASPSRLDLLRSTPGQTTVLAGLDHRTRTRRADLFGEVAVSTGRQTGVAAIEGVHLHPAPVLDVTVVGRFYGTRFTPLRVHEAFAEGSAPTNEAGLYLGTRWRLAPRITLSHALDVYHHPFARFRSALPSGGWETLLRLDVEERKRWQAAVQLRVERSTETEATDDGWATRAQVRAGLRAHVTARIDRAITVRVRTEGSLGGRPDSLQRGHLVYADLDIHPMSRPWRLRGRLTLFGTTGFDARLYAFEPGIPTRFAIPAFSGSGWRMMVLASVDVTHWLEVWVRIEHQVLTDRDQAGSGPTELPGPARTRLGSMLRVRF